MKENQEETYIILAFIAIVLFFYFKKRKDEGEEKGRKNPVIPGGGGGWDNPSSEGEDEGEDGGEDEDPHIIIGGLKAPSVSTQQQQPITQVILQDDVATMETDNNYHTYTVYNNAPVDNAETLSIGNTPQTTYSMRPLGATMYFVGKI